MRHGGLTAFVAGTAVVLVLVGVVPGRAVRAAVGAFPWGGTPRTTTFYTPGEVRLAAHRAGLRVVGFAPFRSRYEHVPVARYVPRLFFFSSKGFIRVGRGSGSRTGLFFISVVVRQPNLDA